MKNEKNNVNKKKKKLCNVYSKMYNNSVHLQPNHTKSIYTYIHPNTHTHTHTHIHTHTHTCTSPPGRLHTIGSNREAAPTLCKFNVTFISP